jgi:hypothetical protein
LVSDVVVDKLVFYVNYLLDQVDDKFFVDSDSLVLCVAHPSARGVDLILFTLAFAQGKPVKKVVFLVLHVVTVDRDSRLNVYQRLQNFVDTVLPVLEKLLVAAKPMHQTLHN